MEALRQRFRIWLLTELLFTFYGEEIQEAWAKAERKRIVGLVERERDTWVKTPTFNYKTALNDLIDRINE